MAEAALALYFAGALVWAATSGFLAALPFLLVFFTGFLYGTLFSLGPFLSLRPGAALRSAP